MNTWQSYVLSTAILLPSAGWAAAWTQPEDKHYAKVWNRTLVGKIGADRNGNNIELDEMFTDTSMNFHVEYGASDSLTLLMFGTPIGWAGIGDRSTTFQGPMGLGSRYGWAMGETRIAAEVRYGFNTGFGANVLDAGFGDDGEFYTYEPSTHVHFADAELQLGYPLSFGWIEGTIGTRVFTHEDYEPAVTGNVQLGHKGKHFTTTAFVTVHQPTGEVELSNLSGAGETRYVGIGVGTTLALSEHWGLTGSIEGAAGYQSNAATPSLTLGIAYH